MVLVLHLVDICSLVQKTISRLEVRRSRFVAGRKNNESGAKRGARADSRPGPRTEVNAMSMVDTLFYLSFLLKRLVD